MPWPIGKSIFILSISTKSIPLIARELLAGRKSKPDRYTFRATDKKMDSRGETKMAT